MIYLAASIVSSTAIYVIFRWAKNYSCRRLLWFILPLAIFVGSGFTDSLIKLIQASQIADEQAASFTTFVFFVAFFLGVIVSLLSGAREMKLTHIPTLLLGILLGIANFGSLFFILNALNYCNGFI